MEVQIPQNNEQADPLGICDSPSDWDGFYIYLLPGRSAYSLPRCSWRPDETR